MGDLCKLTEELFATSVSNPATFVIRVLLYKSRTWFLCSINDRTANEIGLPEMGPTKRAAPLAIQMIHLHRLALADSMAVILVNKRIRARSLSVLNFTRPCQWSHALSLR